MSRTPRAAPLRLLRWFAGLGGAVIALIGLANAWVISSFLTWQLLEREAAVSAEFVQNILSSDGSLGYLVDQNSDQLRERFLGSVLHLTNLKGVLRANVYGVDRRVLWSSDAQLIGKRFGENDELDRAMAGELVVEGGRLKDDDLSKREHEGLSPAAAFFVETYIPVQLPGGANVDGVVELYKAPQALTAAIHEGQRWVAMSATAGALVLYLSLFWLVRRADHTLRRQHEQLRDAETMAAMAELAASVAHNIRNPLASIRSSAELSLDAPGEQSSEHAADILIQVDRISTRINELLRLSSTGEGNVRLVDVADLLRDCVADHQSTFQQRRQVLVFENAASQTHASTDPQLLKQVLQSLLSNASEAMGSDKACQVVLLGEAPGPLLIEVRDAGPGLEPAQVEKIFRPFFTTKPQGLGLGLTLARRIVDRLGGSLGLDSRPGEGTTVRIKLPRS
ncbi:Histidine kinase domain-containing protein [Rubrivivax sp. A210]|uniref:sensor histidine kinase n=1 Tax=Rubrivivax sp. A210 TaxID=2772301 RepID=UPI001918C860|nr:ATP-binding protein [Rubrivivax sp. A210]CAD5371601.1 Histidine kinase domain-containing protein [Rubrivivax sp. A210]